MVGIEEGGEMEMMGVRCIRVHYGSRIKLSIVVYAPLVQEDTFILLSR